MSGALVAWGAPLAAGSGIPEIKTYLNGVRIRGTETARALASSIAAAIPKATLQQRLRRHLQLEVTAAVHTAIGSGMDIMSRSQAVLLPASTAPCQAAFRRYNGRQGAI